MRAVIALLLLALAVPSRAVFFPAKWDPNNLTSVRRAASDAPYIPWELPSPMIEYANKTNRAFNGVAQIKTPSGGCTGFLIRGEQESPAVMVTAGHCTGEALQADIIFRKFKDAPERVKTTVGVTKILWGSLRYFDVGVLQLNVTYGDLSSQGIYGYKMTNTLQSGDPVHFVGVPIIGVVETVRFLRRADCFARGSAVRLAEHSWVWQAARRFDCTGVLGGLSGGPLFNAKNEIVGIVTTTTINGPSYRGPDCYLGNPCELTSTGYRSRFNASYAMDIAALMPCFKNGNFSSDRPGCPLQEARVTLPDGVTLRRQGGLWEVTPLGVADDVKKVAWKVGRLEFTDCTQPQGYRSVMAPNATFKTFVGYKERRWIACAAPFNGTSVQTQYSNFALIKVDRTPPASPPILLVQGGGDGVTIQPVFQIPELVNYLWKIGKRIDCTEGRGYGAFLRNPLFLGKDMLPTKVCLKAQDDVGYWGKPKGFIVSL